ncbi:hypothetical protein LCGC14_0378330 [marine sediment metagenome]|uniref:Uncharacterized protein n=1 Tax=marine sediment metagenome TaxID=412755 RepID=A0A0F9T2T8_9ZZZZ
MAIKRRLATQTRFANGLIRVMSQSRLFPAMEYQSLDVVRQEDEFMGDTLNTFKWGVSNGTGNAAADPVIPGTLVVNGVCDFVTGDAGGSTASSELTGGLTFRGDHGAVIVACLTVDIVTGVKIEFGFTDALADPGAVATKATPSFNATDCALWVFDTDDSGTGWEGLAANNGTTNPMTTLTPSTGAISPVAATYEWLMIELIENDDGNSQCAVEYSLFTADGRRIFNEVAGQVDDQGPNSNVLLTPWLYVEDRNGNSKTMSVDYFGAYQYRTAVQ